MKGSNVVVPVVVWIVLLAAFVPHQLLVAVVALPRFSRLLPEFVAVLPAKRLNWMVTGPAPMAPVATPPPVPVDVLPVMVTFDSVAERAGTAGLTKSPPPLAAPAPFWPFWFPLIMVP